MIKTPKQKADELFRRFLTAIVEEMEGADQYTAKQACLLHLKEQRETLQELYKEVTELKGTIDNTAWAEWRVSLENKGIFFEQVENEINNIQIA
jgi:flavin-binding protein dodecin